jgi:hypothetical protein
MPKAADNVRYCSVSGDVYDAVVISTRNDGFVALWVSTGGKSPLELHKVRWVERPSHTEVPGFAFPQPPESAPPAEAT